MGTYYGVAKGLPQALTVLETQRFREHDEFRQKYEQNESLDLESTHMLHKLCNREVMKDKVTEN